MTYPPGAYRQIPASLLEAATKAGARVLDTIPVQAISEGLLFTRIEYLICTACDLQTELDAANVRADKAESAFQAALTSLRQERTARAT